MQTIRTRAFAGALAIVLTGGALAGCSNPIDRVKNAAANKIAEKSVEHATGEKDVDIDAGNGSESSAKLPHGWPDVPTPSVNPTSSMKLGDTYTAVFLVDPDEAQNMISQFADEGYEEMSTFDSGDGSMVTYSGPEWTAVLSLSTDEDSGKTSLNYVLSPVDDDEADS